jgi:hypothetical protein
VVTKVRVLDVAHDGAVLARRALGRPIDSMDWAPDRAVLFVAAGRVAELVVLRVDDAGALIIASTVQTVPGALRVVFGRDGRAYLADGWRGRALIVAPAP